MLRFYGVYQVLHSISFLKFLVHELKMVASEDTDCPKELGK